MRRILFAVILLFCARLQAAEFKKGFVEIRPNARLYVEQRAAVNGKATLVFLNGLTYSTKQWRELVTALDRIDPDLGIVLYDMVGMGQTLLDRAPVDYDIPFAQQVTDLNALVSKLAISGRKYVIGLSYGGAVALQYMADYPGVFDQAVIMSPFLFRLPAQDTWIANIIKWHRLTYPFDPRADDELYEYYLHNLVFSTYPMAEPILLENPYKLEATYRMVKGARNWKATDVTERLPKSKLHLMAGDQDEYVNIDWLKTFWNQVPDSARASFVHSKDSKHKIPEDKPAFAAAWIAEILAGNSSLQKGLTFEGDPAKMLARSGDLVIDLNNKGNSP